MYLLISIIISILIVLKLFWRSIVVIYHLWNIPGPKRVPFFGNILLFKVSHPKEIVRRYDALFKQFGPLFSFWIGPVPIMLTSEPNYARELLTNSSTLEKSWILRYVFERVFGQSFVLALENEWRPRRKIISGGLNQPMINSYLPVFIRESEYLVNSLEKEVDCGKSFDVFNYLSRTSLDAVCGTSLGINMHTIDCNYEKFFEATNNLYHSVLERLFKFWLIPNKIFERTRQGKVQNDYTKNIISVTKQVLQQKKLQNIEKSREQTGFLDFLQSIPNYDERKIIDDVTFMILAGYESSAFIASYCLLALAAKQDIQNRVSEEIYHQFGNSDRPIELGDLANFEYLDRVIKETLRLFPPVAYVLRNNREDLKLDNKKFPANTNFVISIFHLQRDPKLWRNPLAFDPDRFLPGEIEKRHPFAYIPFAQGPRMCPGYKHAMTFIKVIVITVLRKYRLHTHLELEKLEFILDVSLELHNGHLIQLTRR